MVVPISRRRYYRALVDDARAKTWEDMGGKSLVLGIVLSIAAGLLYVVLTGSQDDPVRGVLAILISAIALTTVVFLAHLALAPARKHEDLVDRWEKSGKDILSGWQATADDWKKTAKETSDSWKASNDAMGYHILRIALIGQLREAAVLRERLADGEGAGEADDGTLRARVDSWDGTTAGYVQRVSEVEKEFYLRPIAVPDGPASSWHEALRHFVMIREGRLEEIDQRYGQNQPGGPATE